MRGTGRDSLLACDETKGVIRDTGQCACNDDANVIHNRVAAVCFALGNANTESVAVYGLAQKCPESASAQLAAADVSLYIGQVHEVQSALDAATKMAVWVDKHDEDWETCAAGRIRCFRVALMAFEKTDATEAVLMRLGEWARVDGDEASWNCVLALGADGWL